jgi:hypothetical protein
MTDFFGLTRREFMKGGALALAGAGMGSPHAPADALDPSTLTPFVDPLPAEGAPRPGADAHVELWGQLSRTDDRDGKRESDDRRVGE